MSSLAGKSPKNSTSNSVGKRPNQPSPSSSASVSKKAKGASIPPEKLIIREDSEEMEEEDDFELHSDFNGTFPLFKFHTIGKGFIITTHLRQFFFPQ